MPDVRNDPYGAFNFLVEIDGIPKAAFSDVSGLDMEIDVIDYRTGGDALHARKLPGLVKYNNIVLKRGITLDHSLWDWIRKVAEATVQRANMTIILPNKHRQPALRCIVPQPPPPPSTA